MSREGSLYGAVRHRVNQRYWAVWSFHFVVYLSYMFLQVTVLDAAFGAVSQVVASIWLLVLLIHALLITGIDLRARMRNRSNSFEMEGA